MMLSMLCDRPLVAQFDSLLLEQLEAASLIKKLKEHDAHTRYIQFNRGIDHKRCIAFQYWRDHAGAFYSKRCAFMPAPAVKYCAAPLIYPRKWQETSERSSWHTDSLLCNTNGTKNTMSWMQLRYMQSTFWTLMHLECSMVYRRRGRDSPALSLFVYWRRPPWLRVVRSLPYCARLRNDYEC
jgi:hypothetical protein